MIRTQHYIVLGSGTNADSTIETAQYVFSNPEDNTVRGFIYKVSPDTIEIVLWQPTELDIPNMINLNEFLPTFDKARMLAEAIGNDPVKKQKWVDLIAYSSSR